MATNFHTTNRSASQAATLGGPPCKPYQDAKPFGGWPPPSGPPQKLTRPSGFSALHVRRVCGWVRKFPNRFWGIFGKDLWQDAALRCQCGYAPPRLPPVGRRHPVLRKKGTCVSNFLTYVSLVPVVGYQSLTIDFGRPRERTYGRVPR